MVAWLYEERYIPIKSVATVLIPDPDKGKGKEFSEDVQQDTGGDATDSAGSGSDGRYVIPDFTDAAGNTFIGCTTTMYVFHNSLYISIPYELLEEFSTLGSRFTPRGCLMAPEEGPPNRIPADTFQC